MSEKTKRLKSTPCVSQPNDCRPEFRYTTRSESLLAKRIAERDDFGMIGARHFRLPQPQCCLLSFACLQQFVARIRGGKPRPRRHWVRLIAMFPRSGSLDVITQIAVSSRNFKCDHFLRSFVWAQADQQLKRSFRIAFAAMNPRFLRTKIDIVWTNLSGNPNAT